MYDLQQTWRHSFEMKEMGFGMSRHRVVLPDTELLLELEPLEPRSS